jgi:hypothetical protein
MGQTEPEYVDFIRRIRQGDQRAAEELVRRYEPQIRTEIRSWLRMRDSRLQRVFDSMDICQSVLADFFTQSARGEFELDEPSQLVRLLIGMAKKKLADRVRFHQRRRRDVRIVGELQVEVTALPVDTERPSRIVAGRELVEMLWGRFSEEERALAEMRAGGDDWATIALILGGTAEARRKQLNRAVTRAAGGLEPD